VFNRCCIQTIEGLVNLARMEIICVTDHNGYAKDNVKTPIWDRRLKLHTEITIASTSGRSSSLHGGAVIPSVLGYGREKVLTGESLWADPPTRRTSVAENRIKENSRPTSGNFRTRWEFHKETSMAEPSRRNFVLAVLFRKTPCGLTNWNETAGVNPTRGEALRCQNQLWRETVSARQAEERWKSIRTETVSFRLLDLQLGQGF